MKVKIVSDGTPQGTKAISLETNEVIENVTRIFWNMDVHSFAKAHIEIINCETEIETEGKIIKEKKK